MSATGSASDVRNQAYQEIALAETVIAAFKHWIFVLVVISVTILNGCASHVHHLESVRTDYYSGNLQQASANIDELLLKQPRDADALKLDQAIVQLTSGNPKGAEQTLRGVRDRLDYLEQRDARELLLSIVKDDQSIAWAGDDYEKVLIRTFLALSNLMNGGDDAIAYALQADQKQKEIIQRIEASRDKDNQQDLDFKRVALGPYLHAAMLEERHLDYDDIQKSRLKVADWETEFRDAQIDLARAQSGRHSEPGNGVLYLFCLVGRGPRKVEAVEVPTSTSILIADRILNEVTEQEVTPTVAPIKVPVVVPGRSLVSEIRVNVDGQPVGSTATITNVSEFAVKQSEANLSNIVARAVVRRTLKKAAIYAFKEKVNAQDSGLTDAALTIAGIAWEATENADTRCWGLLPDKIQVLRIELPQGSHEITLDPLLQSGIARPATTRIEIADGRNSYMLATIPDQNVIGEILTSDRGFAKE